MKITGGITGSKPANQNCKLKHSNEQFENHSSLKFCRQSLLKNFFPNSSLEEGVQILSFKMSENVEKTISANKFSKVKLLQVLGILNRKFNYQTLEFERSWSLDLIFAISLLSKFFYALKLFVSCFFPRNATSQLYFGNPFNHLSDKPKFFMGDCCESIQLI